jgi:hypothetical protein
VNVSHEIDRLLTQLAPETRRQRQSALLRPLNYSLMAVTALGLLTVVFGKNSLADILFLLISLLLNVIVLACDRWNYTHVAAYIFSSWVNSGILGLVLINLLYDRSLPSGVLFASQLALSVMLAGMLISIPFAIFFVTINVVTLMIALYAFTAITGSMGENGAYTHVIAIGVPTTFFLSLIVVITWLYQRGQASADARVTVARMRIIQDEMMRRDLALAREIQRSLLPSSPKTGPALRIAARSEAAREMSGDFYDFIDFDEHTLGIVVADVTGKSVAAALMMALSRVTIRSEARRTTAPAEVLRASNETICRDHSARQLITTFYGVLDTRTLALRFANAGHIYPILRRNNCLTEIELVGMPLGGRPDSTYTEHTLQLEPGDQLFLISDGLVEERNARRDLFGYDRLTAAILATNPSDPDRALEELWQAVVLFRGKNEQYDDMTLLVIQAIPVVTPVAKITVSAASQYAAPS